MKSASGGDAALKSAPGGERLEQAARVFQALGDCTRLSLLRELQGGERTVGDLVRALGAPQPKISQHLKVLRDAGVVGARRDGRQVWYGLNPIPLLGDVPRSGAGFEAWLEGVRPDEVAPPDEENAGRPQTTPPQREIARQVGARQSNRGDLDTHLL